MANSPTTWKVLHQDPTTGQDAKGHYVQGQRIYIQTGMGHSGSLFVPYPDYSADKVRGIIASLAMRLDSVGGLTG